MPNDSEELFYRIADDARDNPLSEEIVKRIHKYGHSHHTESFPHGEITHLVLQAMLEETDHLLSQPLHDFIGDRTRLVRMRRLLSDYLGLPDESAPFGIGLKK